MGFGFLFNIIYDVSVKTGIQQEQLTFLISMVIALVCAFLYRYFFNSNNISPKTRLLFVGCIGLWLQFFSWKEFTLLHIVDTLGSYLILKYFPQKIAYKVNFFWCISFLLCCHSFNAYTFHVQMRFSTDFTGPVMMLTQRLTSIGFNIFDGTVQNDDKLTTHQRKVKTKKFPTPLEFFAYSFCFLGVACGPLVYYSDFIEFIRKDKVKEDKNYKEPPYWPAVSRKLLVTLCSVVIFFFGSNHLPFEKNANEAFIASTPFWQRTLYLYLSLFVCRTKFYFAWSLADAIHNIAGIGFTGYDSDGNAKWDLVTNINIPGIEFATSMKPYIDNWNITTSLWLRNICYERMPRRFKMPATFLLSALWHGLLPGYYITFLSGNLFTYVQRLVRKLVRPYFLQSKARKFGYDILTWLATQLAISYICISFMLLEARTSLIFFKSFYFCGHIIGIAIIILLPIMYSSSKKGRHDTVSKSNGNHVENNNNVFHSNRLIEEKMMNGLRHR